MQKCNTRSTILVVLNMAKQSGEHTITGTIGNLCFYQMDGNHYVRLKSSLTGKRVKKDPAFAGTMRSAHILATASKIASNIYKKIPAEQKVKRFYRKLTGEAMQLLKKGNLPAIVIRKLQENYLPKLTTKVKRSERTVQTREQLSFADAVLESIFSKEIIKNFVHTKIYVHAPT